MITYDLLEKGIQNFDVFPSFIENFTVPSRFASQ